MLARKCDVRLPLVDALLNNDCFLDYLYPLKFLDHCLGIFRARMELLAKLGYRILKSETNLDAKAQMFQTNPVKLYCRRFVSEADSAR